MTDEMQVNAESIAHCNHWRADLYCCFCDEQGGSERCQKAFRVQEILARGWFMAAWPIPCVEGVVNVYTRELNDGYGSDEPDAQTLADAEDALRLINGLGTPDD